MWNFKQINCTPGLIHTENIILIDFVRDDINNLVCNAIPRSFLYIVRDLQRIGDFSYKYLNLFGSCHLSSFELFFMYVGTLRTPFKTFKIDLSDINVNCLFVC